MKTALLAVAALPLAIFFACADQTNDPSTHPTASELANTAPASNCASRCAAIAVSCGTDPAECSSLCLSITEGQLTCLEDSDCDGAGSGACGADAGPVAEAGSETGTTGECTPINSACASAAECCEGAACTNVIGTSNMVCCMDVLTTCADDQDCCSTHCSENAKCCYAAGVSCTADTAASCCSGVCGDNGLCN